MMRRSRCMGISRVWDVRSGPLGHHIRQCCIVRFAYGRKLNPSQSVDVKRAVRCDQWQYNHVEATLAVKRVCAVLSAVTMSTKFVHHRRCRASFLLHNVVSLEWPMRPPEVTVLPETRHQRRERYPSTPSYEDLCTETLNAREARHRAVVIGVSMHSRNIPPLCRSLLHSGMIKAPG
ncbi:uncharacterized protein LAESUDRAFT_225733 [Laetiporus sulphureus 93-53]|uniref:Uncharacterized protein n=1 Tax=Laetiporus sulphureus 93-53 TaxID=1314785 RepID=A0A165DPM8_9APHY|nr:uncharacterized protein LAESUDRAFT_225733 [Laetiporus sulphureus 93-53]KZT05348.1 hypothetical protein LAESUDRAFT_225733 [Laetiporus sulphureus 93-53]